MREDRAAKARQRAAQLSNKITPRMVAYLMQLLNDCGFGDRLNRNSYLSRVTGREVRFVDELTFDEAKSLINTLEARRDNKDEPPEDNGI